MTKALAIILTFMISTISFELPGAQERKIDVIYVYHSEIGLTSSEYKIDLKNKQLWEFDGNLGSSDYKVRNESAEDEGFTFVKALDDNKIKGFLDDCRDHRFAFWEGYYHNPNVNDGHQWGITIIYSDTASERVGGSNAYPDTWDEMRQALIDLTDKDILTCDSEGRMQ